MPRVEQQLANRLGQLRQIEAFLLQRHLASHQVFAAGDALSVQCRAGSAGNEQRLAVQADGCLIDRPTLGVELQRLLTEGISEFGGDGLLIVWVGDLVVVLEHQRLAVIQAQHQPACAWRVLPHRDDTATGWQRQRLARQQCTVAQPEEAHLPVGTQAHCDLVLLLHRQQQRLAGIGQPGRLLRRAAFQLGALEHWQYDLRQVEEDQGNGDQHRQTADGHVPACQVIFQRADAALALQRRRVEVQPLHIGIRGHVFHVVHARAPGPERPFGAPNLMKLCDRKITAR